MNELDLHSILGDALSAEIGVEVSTSDPQLLKNRLYALMKESAEYSRLALITHPTKPDAAICIVKKAEEKPDATE